MAYQKTIWSPGDTISSARLNNIENGIEGLETEVAAASQVDTTLTVSGKAADAKTTGDQLSELKNGIAPIFSKSNAYAAGTYVWVGQKLYRFTRAHNAGNWTGVDAEQVVLDDEIADVKSDLNSLNDTVATISSTQSGFREDVIGVREDVIDIKEDIVQAQTDIGALQNAVNELEEGSLPADSARLGDIPVAHGNGTWNWLPLEHITPIIFGAAGDGSTDDTTALSTAFNRSNAVIDGMNKYYKLTEITMTERSNLVIQNFRFYHGICIKLKHCENIIFRNCVWDEFQDNGIPDKKVFCVLLTTIHTGSDEWVEENNWRMDEVCKRITFENCQFIGTHFTENTPSLYDGTKPHYNTGICIRMEGVDQLRVLGCYFTQNRGNACIHHNGYCPLGDFEIRNNLFYLNCWGGISLYRYTGMSSYPTRIIQGNRFIGHGLGYLPWEYLEKFPEKERGVGTAVLLGGHAGRIKNEPAYCSVCDNHFEDNNESSVEGWQWNPVRNNTIVGQGVLQTPESVIEMRQKYKITYPLYVRINPSQNPIYIGQYHDVQRYPAGETRVIENNTISRMYGTFNPILIRGYFYEQVLFRNNSITDAELYLDENKKYAHFLWCTFKKGLNWENNIGIKPYFNGCTFEGGKYHLDELEDIYDSTFVSQAFESTSKIDRFQQVRSARFNPEYATLRDNSVSTLSNGKPVLGFSKHTVAAVVPDADWDIRDESGYTEGGYVFGGEANPTVLNTGMALGATDRNWTIFVDTTTTGDNDAGDNSYLIKLLTFSDDSGTVSLELGSRYKDQSWTWIFPNAVWSYDNAYRIDGSTSKAFLGPGYSSRFVLRHKAGSGKIEVFVKRSDGTVAAFDSLKYGEYAFTSGTAGTLRFGGVLNSNRPKSYYNGKIKDALVYEKCLSDSQVSMLMLNTDIAPDVPPVPVYDISDESGYVEGTGLVMDGTYGIDTQIPLLENTNDFTIICRFKFDKMRGENGQPNFTFFPVFSAMSAEMAPQGHGGYTDKGFDVGLSMQDGQDMETLALGGFINFRRDWRYRNSSFIDSYNYNNYFNIYYTVIVRRENNVITLYDNNLVEITRLTGDYATAIINGNLTIGARMGYGAGYTDFFKGVITDFRVYDSAIDMGYIEQEYPSINDNDVSDKGAITYHLSNKSNTRKRVRVALVEINYDLGGYNSAEYTAQYPRAFAVRLDKIYDDLFWVPCSSSKRVTFLKKCKWDAVYDPFTDWNMEIINPGIVPGMDVTITGVKVLLLSKQEAVATTNDATDFNLSWSEDLTGLSVGGTVTGYTQYVPEEANSGLTLTVASDDTSVATVSVSGLDVIITGVGAGETLIHVSIPFGTEHTYSVAVSDS